MTDLGHMAANAMAEAFFSLPAEGFAESSAKCELLQVARNGDRDYCGYMLGWQGSMGLLRRNGLLIPGSKLWLCWLSSPSIPLERCSLSSTLAPPGPMTQPLAVSASLSCHQFLYLPLKPPKTQNLLARQAFWLQGAAVLSGHLRVNFCIEGTHGLELLGRAQAPRQPSTHSTLTCHCSDPLSPDSCRDTCRQAELVTTGELIISPADPLQTTARGQRP